MYNPEIYPIAKEQYLLNIHLMTYKSKNNKVSNKKSMIIVVYIVCYFY